MTLVANLFMMIDESCPKPGHCEVRQTSTKCDYEESKRLWGAHQKMAGDRAANLPRQLNPSSLPPFMSLSWYITDVSVLAFMMLLLCTRIMTLSW